MNNGAIMIAACIELVQSIQALWEGRASGAVALSLQYMATIMSLISGGYKMQDARLGTISTGADNEGKDVGDHLRSCYVGGHLRSGSVIIPGDYSIVVI